MDLGSSLPPSPGGGNSPLQPVSHNQQRENASLLSSLRQQQLHNHNGSSLSLLGSSEQLHHRDSSVHDKISQFNSLAMQSKQLERKTADAALKRAMLGREEAEAEMRRFREEARVLRRQIDEGKERERRVGERLETVMENYGRAKETHAHTQALWEKEIRRARKETFKAQSATVKLQEELKAARDAHKAADDALAREKDRSRAREQEAFQARYELVGLQEQLDQAVERARTLEQERDAFRSLASSEEEVRRIASAGLLPLPMASVAGEEEEEDEFASPRKGGRNKKPRVSSVSLADVKSSAASEAEIDELTEKWLCERQRADRACELIEFLEAECHLRCCPCAKAFQMKAASSSPRRQKRPTALKIEDAGDVAILSGDLAPFQHPGSPVAEDKPLSVMKKSKTEMLREKEAVQSQGEKRRSTIFVPSEGIFRTVSQAEAEAMVDVTVLPSIETTTPVEETHPEKTLADEDVQDQPTSSEEPREPTPADEPARSSILSPVVEEAATSRPTSAAVQPDEATSNVIISNPPCYARTPSVEPPSFAVSAIAQQQRTSLLSLLEAPHRDDLASAFASTAAAAAAVAIAASVPSCFHVPTMPGPDAASPADDEVDEEELRDEEGESAAGNARVVETEIEAANTLDLVDSVTGSRGQREYDHEHEQDGDGETGQEHGRGGYQDDRQFDDDYAVTDGGDFDSDDDRNTTITQTLASSRPASVILPPPVSLRPQDQEVYEREHDQQQQPAPTTQPTALPTSHTAPTVTAPPYTRPHTSAACYTASVKTITTTTKVPLREETSDPSLATRLMALQRTPSHGSMSSNRRWGHQRAVSQEEKMQDEELSFDPSNPALTPTMTREQALAQIRERRGRARSVNKGVAAGTGQGAAAAVITPRMQVGAATERRDVSAPSTTGARKAGLGVGAGVGSVGRRVRS